MKYSPLEMLTLMQNNKLSVIYFPGATPRPEWRVVGIDNNTITSGEVLIATLNNAVEHFKEHTFMKGQMYRSSNGLVVLCTNTPRSFTDTFAGTVIVEGESSVWRVGEHSGDWLKHNFKHIYNADKETSE